MDFEQNNSSDPNQPYQTPQQPTPPQPQPQPAFYPDINAQLPKKEKISGWRIFWRIVLVLSVLANIFLFFMLIVVAGAFLTGQAAMFETPEAFVEKTVAEGDSSDKIAIIRLQGIIDGNVSEEIRKQIEIAADDPHVKAVIIRTVTPGGGVSASDQIHHEITKFRNETEKPVVAFMQTVAASGGYYTSVACDKIVAEPTVITGSIGVIMNHMVFKELLEQKLGIAPVVVKSGLRKDWPSPFSETTEEQKQYLDEKLIKPAYNRFVDLVAQGRENLDPEQTRILADGSIYGAAEALEKGLIDEIGYIETAITVTENLAGIEDARVIEYARPWSFSSIFGAESETIWNLDRKTLTEFTIPQLLYLWDANW